MFRDAVVVRVSGVEGEARAGLARRLLGDFLNDQTARALGGSGGGAPSAAAVPNPAACPVAWAAPELDGSLDLGGGGDTRPLVLRLRAVAFFAAAQATAIALAEGAAATAGGAPAPLACRVRVRQSGAEVQVALLPASAAAPAAAAAEPLAPPLRLGLEGDCLFPVGPGTTSLARGPFDPSVLRDPRAVAVRAALAAAPALAPAPAAAAAVAAWDETLSRLGHVVDYFFADALAPAVVIVCGKPALASSLVDLLAGGGSGGTAAAAAAAGEWCAPIRGVEPEQCKMTRSLYDSRATRNLRDDIIAASRGGAGRAVVEILAATPDSQLLIRELVEDSPSMTAFSTARSALYKRGLFFVIVVEGRLTPELASRASVVIS